MYLHFLSSQHLKPVFLKPSERWSRQVIGGIFPRIVDGRKRRYPRIAAFDAANNVSYAVSSEDRHTTSIGVVEIGVIGFFQSLGGS